MKYFLMKRAWLLCVMATVFSVNASDPKDDTALMSWTIANELSEMFDAGERGFADLKTQEAVLARRNHLLQQNLADLTKTQKTTGKDKKDELYLKKVQKN